MQEHTLVLSTKINVFISPTYVFLNKIHPVECLQNKIGKAGYYTDLPDYFISKH